MDEPPFIVRRQDGNANDGLTCILPFRHDPIKIIEGEGEDRVRPARYELPGKSFLLEKSGSVVRFTPSFLKPASSPGVGMWVM
jgi:hypothetical protein